MLLAGVFVYCAVLGLQGFAAQLLPRRLFLRASSFLQLAAFCAIVCVYCLQPVMATPQALMEANGRGLLAWSPSYWFLGLFQQLNGSPALARAGAARVDRPGRSRSPPRRPPTRSLTSARSAKIVEEPDIVAGARGGAWLPRFGDAVETAIVQFSLRTLLRSRLHRIILAFYLGVGFALAIALVKNSGARPPGGRSGRRPMGPGDRTVAGGQHRHDGLRCDRNPCRIFHTAGPARKLDLPRDRCAPRARVPGGQPGVRFSCSRQPRCGWPRRGSAFRLWPWRAAAGHLAILAVIGSDSRRVVPLRVP